MSKSHFDTFNAFIKRRRRWIIVGWIIAALISMTLIPSFFSAVSYNITGAAFGGPTNTESQKAQNILNAEFPFTTNRSDNSIILVVQGAQVYSNSVKNTVLALNNTFARDAKITNYTGMTSVYSTEYGLLNSSLPKLVSQVANLQSNITSINKALHSLEQNLSSLSTSIFRLQQGINQTSQLVFGVPSIFLQIWEGVVSQGVTNPYIADDQANATIYQLTNSFGGQVESIGYYSIFLRVWNSSFQNLPNSTTPIQRESFAINQTVSTFLSNPQISPETEQIITTVASGLNVTDWNQKEAISNLTISTLASSIPLQLSSALGVTPQNLVFQLYNFGPSPSNETLANYTISLFETSFTKNASELPSSGVPVSGLLRSSYDLGSSPSITESWKLASAFIANATASLFSESPLFSVNKTSFGNLLSTLSKNSTSVEIRNAINDVIFNQSFQDYPFMPTRSITKNFVSASNDTMIVIYNFSSQTDPSTIAQFGTDVHSSGLDSLGTIYITGTSVLTQDVQKTFTPALGITVGPGVAISILIVGLLFLSPLAALIPILLGGLSIAIAYPAIYLGIVVIGHGNITFLTPTLTTLLMLGLAVDYAVLQLRRTREERLKGKSTEESVGISVRWAGQAVLTAGITVIVAYIVMAVANVPLFSDVGTAIAIGVSILLAISLTLLPSLELTLGDKLFWPGIKRYRKMKTVQGPRRLERIAEGTLKRKVAITVVISLVALGALYTTYGTPVGADFLKLIPNFPSNQGLTAITNSLGSGTIAPTTIIVTTPTPITYGNNQFNQTLLNQIELVSANAANSSGVVSVTGPTRPYGSPFNYSGLENMSEPIRLQYEAGMFSQIGENNKTVLINIGLSFPSESPEAISSLLNMEHQIDKLSLTKGISLYYGGDTQSTYDNQSFLLGLLPQVVLILAAAVYVILLLQLRSVFTPIRLIFTILCSVVFSLALLSLIFYYGMNLPILDFAPLFVVVTMLGVGIDYDIFFVTRIREEVLNGNTDNEAIKTAVDKVWVTILGLGLVLSTVFASLLITGIAILQEISLVVAAAILIDVLVVIPFFVPSLMGLAERFNWWPSRIGRTDNKTKNS